MNHIAANSQLIQKANRLKVLNYIRRNPDVPRIAIAQETGLSVSSLTNITAYLLEKELLTENGTENVGRVGRKGTLLRFHADAYGLICVILSVDSINIAYTNLEGRIITHISVNTDTLHPMGVIDIVRNKISGLIEKYGRKQTLGIEIAISGLVLNGSRFILSSSLKWTKFDLKEILEKETGIPVFIENISVLRAVWCFCCGKHDNKENMLLVDLKNGIGACQYYNSEINLAMLGEIGHTTVEKEGEPCFCGNKGCLEAMCSVQRIEQLYSQYSDTCGVPIAEISKRFAAGDSDAERAVTECAQYLGIGLANLVNLCKPSVMVINIGSFAPLKAVIDLAAKELRRRAYPVLLEDLAIREASISEEEAICGAAFNLCDRLFAIDGADTVLDSL